MFDLFHQRSPPLLYMTPFKPTFFDALNMFVEVLILSVNHFQHFKSLFHSSLHIRQWLLVPSSAQIQNNLFSKCIAFYTHRNRDNTKLFSNCKAAAVMNGIEEKYGVMPSSNPPQIWELLRAGMSSRAALVRKEFGKIF